MSAEGLSRPKMPAVSVTALGFLVEATVSRRPVVGLNATESGAS